MYLEIFIVGSFVYGFLVLVFFFKLERLQNNIYIIDFYDNRILYLYSGEKEFYF